MITAIVFCLVLGAAAWVWNSREDVSELPGFLAGGMMLLVMGFLLWLLIEGAALAAG